MVINRRSALIAAGMLAFVLAVLAGVPAGAAIRWLGPESVRATGITGTLWEGAALGIDLGGTRLGETQWDFSPLRLLTGRLAGSVTTRLGEGVAKGNVSLGVTGAIACFACSYEGPAAGLQPVVPALGSVGGRVVIEVEVIEIDEGWPTRAVGAATLSDAALAQAGGGTDATNAAFTASFASDPVEESGLIEASVQDAGGPFELNARLLLMPPGSFELTGRIKARPGAPPEIINALALLGPKAADGSTEVSLSGTL
jgi:general secretion pathway protein N